MMEDDSHCTEVKKTDMIYSSNPEEPNLVAVWVSMSPDHKRQASLFKVMYCHNQQGTTLANNDKKEKQQ